MIREAKEQRAAARGVLSGNWLDAVVVTLVFIAINFAAPQLIAGRAGESGEIYVSLSLQILLLPLGWSYYVLLLLKRRGLSELKVDRLFDGYRDFTRVLSTMLLSQVYTFLWTLLFIIPGIVKSFSYALTPYILKDHPEMKNNQAIELSMAMMKGHKFDLFYLELTFIGWILLGIITAGIGFLWVLPYMYTATAEFYEDVKAEYEAAHA